MSEMPFELILHIGAGKTGSSSIQESLRLSKEKLNKDGWDYWGLMLESAPIVGYAWQKASGTKEFLALSPEDAQEQVFEILSRSVDCLRSTGYRAAVWSNEWFFGRHTAVVPALKRLERTGVDVKIVAYVRRHDAWAKSAYIQWGIKHKSYAGPLVPFTEYVKKRPVRFAGTLQPWVEAFPDAFRLRNFDATSDVVSDFLKTTGLTANIRAVRVNESPQQEELLLRALYNNSVKGEVLPSEFDRRFWVKESPPKNDSISWIHDLLPDENDLSSVVEGAAEDRRTLNLMLEGMGQEPLDERPLDQKKFEINRDVLFSNLFQVLIKQERRIQRMQGQINKILKNLVPEEDQENS